MALATLFGVFLSVWIHSVLVVANTEWSVPDSTFEEVTEAQNDGVPVLALIYRGAGDAIEQRNSEFALPMWDMVARKLSGAVAVGERAAAITAAGERKFAKWWQNLERNRATKNLGQLMIRRLRVDSDNQQKVVDTFEVEHIPEVVLLRTDGGNAHYKGQLKSQLVVNWANWLLNRTHPLHSVEDLDNFLHGSGLAAVGLFESEEVPEAVSFAAVARHPSILKRNIAMAAAYGEQLSVKLADRLRYHMRLRCMTFTVGPSSSQQMSLPLHRAGKNESWECSSAPVDPRGLAYGEEAGPQFTSHVLDGKSLIVSRTDADAHKGWIRHLHLKCCITQPEARIVEDLPVPSVVMLTASDSFVSGAMPDGEGLRQWMHESVVIFDGSFVVELDDANYDVIFDLERASLPVLLAVPPRGKRGEVMRSLLDDAVPHIQGRAVIAVLRPGPVLETLEEQWHLPKVQADEDDTQDNASDARVDVEAEHDIWSIRTGVYLLDQSDLNQRRKYQLEGEINVDSLFNFVRTYEMGMLHAMIRTEPLPSYEDMFAGPVRNLVGSMFDEVTQNAAHDVLVLIYAPWCGHCQRFKKTYMQLAGSLRNVSTLEFTHMDGTRNEVGDYQVRSYPTVFLFPAGDRKHEVFSFRGVRPLEEVRSWLHEHCTYKFNVKITESASIEIPSDGLLGPSEEEAPSNDL